ncbi:MAG: glycosyltransferase family 4 protein [candidate division Zixibacteria bacterium]|nr:glycosyltransferase family 4 protein [candidate division Zixibacteria bacterium]
MAQTTHNILLLNSIEAGVWGGLEHWMELTGIGLAQRGHRVTFAGREGSVFLRRISAHPEAVVAPLTISGDFHPTTVRQLAEAASAASIDLMLCNFVKDVRLAELARTFHHLNYRIIWTPGVNLAKKTLSHKFLFSRFVDMAIVPSNALRDDIIASGFLSPERFEVIPIGLDETLWRGTRDDGRRFLMDRYDLPDDAFVCLTSGRFVPQKGHQHLIEAARLLADRQPNIFYLFLGDGPRQTDLMELVKRYELTDRFIFGGLLDDHRRIVFAADLYVHPAVIEPYGIVLVEAMAAGLPTVATRVGGIPEVVVENETALLINPADPAALAEAIERMTLDHRRRDAFGLAGRERFRACFRLETMIDRLEACLDEVMVR